MKSSYPVRGLLLSLLLAASSATAPAFAQVSISISIAPPAPHYELVPVLAPGYAWAPGYWAWNVDRHIWIRGRRIVQRDGYRWQPDRWEQRGAVYYRDPGRWERDSDYRVMKMKTGKKVKHRDDGRDDDERGHGNSGKHGKHGKGDKHDR